jgi:class 3 adenylate cyclase
MFCDLVRSTELAARLDPEELRDVLRAYQDVADGAVRHFGGTIARYVGDGLLIYFGYPQAHEDDAPRAVRAALGIVAAVRELHGRLAPAIAALSDIPQRAGALNIAILGTRTSPRRDLARPASCGRSHLQ